jgi:hypothetical protein
MSENTSQQSAPVALAWLAVVAGIVGNTVASVAGSQLLVNVGFGALTTLGVVTLVLHWLRRR